MRRPLRRLTQSELDDFLDKAADILRGNVDHSEFRGYVFGLLFFKRISDVYEEEVARLQLELGDPELAREPRMHNFVVPEESLWGQVARTTKNQLGTALNEAMIAVERANQPKFDGILTNKIDYNKTDELPREKLVNLINHFSSHTFDHAHVSDDVFGNAYEHLIRNFASKAGKSSGEFYTPTEVAYLMAEMIEPRAGQSISDWASGSGGLLLQCRNYVTRQGGDANQLRLFAQESNVATYNISRINMILHGVREWNHKREDSIRTPQLLDDQQCLLTFDRIVMNPPFSLEDWGYDDLIGGDPHGRFSFGMPPRDNGDYAWLQQVVKSLKNDGKAVIVMSQGVLFRGQPEQSLQEDGVNRKADVEFIIRAGFIQADLIECIVVLPSKLFYGNSVPACLLVLNKKKSEERKRKVLMIWASRHFEKANPQNLLRPSDLMRILVPWRAFGKLATAKGLIATHEERLVLEQETERDRRLQDIEDAYSPLLLSFEAMTQELASLTAADFKAWSTDPDPSHPFFGHLTEIDDRKKLRLAAAESKKSYRMRLKEVKAAIRMLTKVTGDRERQVQEVHKIFDQEIELIREAGADLSYIYSDPAEARRNFAVVDVDVLKANEFNLNVPRYVDTFPPEEVIEVADAIKSFKIAEEEATTALGELYHSLGDLERD